MKGMPENMEAYADVSRLAAKFRSCRFPDALMLQADAKMGRLNIITARRCKQ
jgi:hypothetical protein